MTLSVSKASWSFINTQFKYSDVTVNDTRAPVQAGTCRYKGSVEQAVGMTYYRLIQDGEDDILQTVAEQGPVVVSIDHQTRTFMVCTPDNCTSTHVSSALSQSHIYSELYIFNIQSV